MAVSLGDDGAAVGINSGGEEGRLTSPGGGSHHRERELYDEDSSVRPRPH